jgi:hypothetical protein
MTSRAPRPPGESAARISTWAGSAAGREGSETCFHDVGMCVYLVLTMVMSLMVAVVMCESDGCHGDVSLMVAVVMRVSSGCRGDVSLMVAVVMCECCHVDASVLEFQ